MIDKIKILLLLLILNNILFASDQEIQNNICEIVANAHKDKLENILLLLEKNKKQLSAKNQNFNFLCKNDDFSLGSMRYNYFQFTTDYEKKSFSIHKEDLWKNIVEDYVPQSVLNFLLIGAQRNSAEQYSKNIDKYLKIGEYLVENGAIIDKYTNILTVQFELKEFYDLFKSQGNKVSQEIIDGYLISAVKFNHVINLKYILRTYDYSQEAKIIAILEAKSNNHLVALDALENAENFLAKTDLDNFLIKLKPIDIQYNSFALVIGVNKYINESDVPFADNSAKSFALALQKIVGLPKENIKVLINENATSGQIKSELQVISQMADKDSKIYVYFAGHGVPGKNGKTYILPSDMKAENIEIEERLQLNEIYKSISGSQAKHSYVILDSCFSGKDDSGKLLYNGAAPVMMVEKQKPVDAKMTILTAGAADHFANQYEKEKQRLFTYYIIDSLVNQKRAIQDIYSYAKNKTFRESLKIGMANRQKPQIDGIQQGDLW